MLGAKKTVNL
uniref:Uncharacterized protein n=1 Tax=Anguilla anguilla TaxID=7936 RepID=A0A0E9QCV9_ANGAN